MEIHKYVNKIKDFILDTIFPTKCIGCNIKNQILCNDCIRKISLNEREIEGGISAVFNYQDPIIKKAIWELKYHHKRYIGEKLGQLLYEYLIEDISDIKMSVPGRSIYVVPTPISIGKTKTRGYNQALVLSKSFCDSCENKVFEIQNKIVIKKLDTIPQAKITNRKKRLENVRGVFEIKNKEIVKGRTIIVIDDVTTTGGTMLEIMKVLKKAGAKKVYGFAVAH
ncbi:MAG: phosphoribosyltransferase family protein [Candidatus Nomurabacteria bacterium]|nr:phosphoribosyltransferase family protein [Candidatus Nomurabacteria bacterium]